MTPLGLRDRFEELGRHEAFRGLLAALRTPDATLLQVSGLTPTACAAYVALLQRKTGRPLILLTGGQAAAELFHETLKAWFELAGGAERDREPCLLPTHDVTPFDGLSPHPDISERRGIGLWRMAEGQVSVVVAPVGAVLLRAAPARLYRQLAWRIQTGQEVLLEELELSLVALGYSRREPVDMVGHFSVRGGIIDVFPPESERPFRFTLFGDQVDSIREFNPETQQSVRRRDSVAVLPMQEYAAGGSGQQLLPSGWEFTVPGEEWRSGTALDLVRDAIVVWHEPQLAAQEAEAWQRRLEEAAARTGGVPDRYYWSLDQLTDRARARQQIVFDELGLAPPRQEPAARTWHIRSSAPPRFQGNVVHCVQEIKAQIAAGSRVLVAANSPGDLERLADLFKEYEVPCQLVFRERPRGVSRYLEEKAYVAGPVAAAVLVQAAIATGCALPDSLLTVYGTQDIFSASDLVPKPRKRKAAQAAFLTDLEDLHEGDFVVHAQHGVGRYRGSRRIETAGRSEDFMVLEYAEGAKLYLPLARLDLVHAYHGAGGPQPQVDRLGGQTWERTKKKVKARLLDMADDLLKLYAQRKLGREFVYSPDSNWQREFEDAFAHEPTADQQTAAAEIKRDMESSRIMDRLICGDVGFGKTEVAMRAAFKALGDDKQVAVLVPTTVLAFQHLETFRQRFEAFPIEIEMLSRFRSAKEQRAILERLRDGRIDIVIGTHRLLSKDVGFSDLGLLVVDEEQRFGVRHKERLKQVRKNVDVLALTATPIPRTLYMSLMGLRDVSVIQTPPQDRLAIQTVVAEYDDHLVRTAIRREVARGGQVYFLHNRVESIQAVAGKLATALPDVRIRVGHGQMGERDLEAVMLGFMRHEFDVLVSTTIIENGLDIPLANTMVIDRADLYGLAELYQLRGRVGRSNRRAYAYLLVPADRELREVARKRLAALREFSELGSGFKTAALDLELRGAGNLLGGEQSGQVAAVGFETYTQLLEEAVRKLQGDEVEERIPTQLKLQLDFHIPTDYVPEETQRLRLYKRLAGVREESERAEVAAELKDRYGPPPAAVRNLLEHSILKHRAEELRIPLLERRGERLRLRFREDSRIDPQKLMRFVAATRGARFAPDGTFEWPGFHYQGAALFEQLNKLLDRLAV